MVQDRHIPGLIKITINQLDIDVAPGRFCQSQIYTSSRRFP
jgi:hypothetical protein